MTGSKLKSGEFNHEDRDLQDRLDLIYYVFQFYNSLYANKRSNMKIKNDCKTVFEAVCETRYHEKNITEDRPKCENRRQKMCNEKGEDCMEYTRRVILFTFSSKKR